MEKIKYISIKANNSKELGYKLGKELREEINLRIEKNKLNFQKNKLNYSKLISKVKKFIPIIKEQMPELFLEAKEISRGAKTNFYDELITICDEEVLFSKISRCTSIAIHTKDNELIIGHNEDWIQDYCKNGLYILDGKIKETKFLTLSYMGNLPGTSCSLNSFGIGYTGNSLNFKKLRYGIPRSFQLRSLLTAKNLIDCKKILNLKKRSISSNTLIAKTPKLLEDIEDYFLHQEIFNNKKWIIHTNHPLKHKEQNKINTSKESIKRFLTAKKIIDSENNPNIETVKKILKDHSSQICSHKNRKEPNAGVTIASAIINLNQKYMDICHGNPCRNKYIRYDLK